MRRWGRAATLTITAAASLFCAAPGNTGSQTDLVREALLQQSPAQRTGCTGVQRTLNGGADATLVTRTAVEIGYNPCQVIRCALEGSSESERKVLCEKVLRGAALAGVQPDVISRCSAEFCDPAAVAAILGDAFLEPNYCYFAARPLVAPEIPLAQDAVVGRSTPAAQASPFRF